MKSAGTTESTKLREAFLKLEMKTLLPGTFQLDPSNGKQVGQTLGVVQWQSGTRQIIAPTSIATAQPVLALASWDKR